jgi:hypothetical protein
MSNAKDPRLVSAGKRGAERRWGPPRRPYIGDLSNQQRRLILAAIEAEREKIARNAA